MRFVPMTFLHSLWNRIAVRRADMLGREQGQTIVRVVVSTIVICYLLALHAPFDFTWPPPFWPVFAGVFLAFSVVVALSALRARQSSVWRRFAANVVDVSAVTYLMATTGEASAPLFVIYLWVTLGNGFRFGLAAMGFSALLSVAGFAVVTVTSDFWLQHQTLAVGVMIALLVLPGYAAHLIRQLHRARERAEEASAAKSQFLARMSHELRTPLNGILGTTELLRDNRRLTNADHELLGVIQESASVSLRQIDSVLDFARIEAGKLVLEQAEFDLHRMLNATVRMVGPAAREKNLRLLLRISPQAPYRLIGDSHRLREVLLNLLSNAIKFTHAGYVALQVEPIGVTESTVRLRFEIRDTGIGIGTDALDHIWESFTQEDPVTNRRYSGTGIGTTIAKQLVELMHGRIAVSSIKGRGAVFWCDLPFQRCASGHGPIEKEVPGARLLAVTTDTALSHHLQYCIERCRGTLLTVASVAEAIEALGRGIRLSNPWQLVLVDEKLAVTSGGQHRADRLAANALIAQTPLYLVTDAAHEIEQLCEWGYAGLLPRLPTADVLFNAIHAAPHYEIRTDSATGVLRVEPWAWGREAKTAARILIADDNRINCLILEQILSSAGYAVDIANDGESALRRLTTDRYRAAILDLHMPGMGGDDLLRRYRLQRPGARIPIIMLTADMTFDAKSGCAEAGADAFLTKPASAETLLFTLERLIHERQVHNLPVSTTAADNVSAEAETPTLDVALLSELDRLSRDSTRLQKIIETFETEGEELIRRITEAADARNHPAFMEWVHALNGNAMNVGALRLMAACQRFEVAGTFEFHQHGVDWAQEIGEQLVAACRALRALCPGDTHLGHSGPV